MTDPAREHTRAHPGHVVTRRIDGLATCDRGDYRDPLADLRVVPNLHPTGADLAALPVPPSAPWQHLDESRETR